MTTTPEAGMPEEPADWSVTDWMLYAKKLRARLEQEVAARKAAEDDAFHMAAGQCIIDGGLLGDEGGNLYCAMKQRADSAIAALTAQPVQPVPCRHEWYTGSCVHCELTVSEYRATAAAQAMQKAQDTASDVDACNKDWRDTLARAEQQAQGPVAKKPCPACGGPLVECENCEGGGDEPNTDNDVTGPSPCHSCGGLGGHRLTAPSPDIAAGMLRAAEIPALLKYMVDWERTNGCLAGILEDEYPDFMRELKRIAIVQSPRQAEDSLRADAAKDQP